MEIKQKTNSFLNETIYEAHHPSGCGIYLLNKPGFHNYYAVFATDYGSVDSNFCAPGDAEAATVPDGIAHYLEHKMFEEPDRNIFDDFAKQGANANAFTSSEMTAYLFSCTEHFEENLKTLLHYVQNPYFTDENVEKERGIIGQEIRMYDDHPYWRVTYNFLGLLYHNHPVKLDTAGTVESISEISKELLYRCYNTFYHLSNMSLFIVGDLDVERTFQLVFDHLKDQKYPGEIERIYPEEPNTVCGKKKTQYLPVSMPMAILGYKETVFPNDSYEIMKRQIETELVLEMLFGKSSAFYETYYQQGLINDSFSSAYESGKGFAYSEIFAETPDPEKLYSAVMEEVARVQREGLSEADFERIKKALYGSYIMDFDHGDDFANSYVSWKFKGIDMFDFDEVYRTVTFADLTKRFEEHFIDENAVLSVVKSK
jgi:predicted Zn-dependent peptidase